MRNIKTRILSTLCALSLLLCNSCETKALTYSNDEYSTSLWFHDYIDTQEAWDLLDQYKPNPVGRIVMASIDTGVILDHPDIKENLDTENCVRAMKNGKMSKYTEVKFTHGTAEISTMIATSNNGLGCAGVASCNRNNRVSLMAIDAMSYNSDFFTKGTSRGTTVNDILRGIRYAANHGARVIHICMGFNEKFKDVNGNFFNYKKLDKGISKILKEHPETLIVAAAGNRSSDKAWYPASCKGVLSVINTVEYDNAYSKSVMFFNSNYGGNRKISAPGTEIPSTRSTDTYYLSKGTSAASAVVAGVAALVFSANPNLKAEQVKKILCGTTTDLYKDGFDKYTGFGNVNAYNAVAAALKLAGYSGFPDKLPVPKCPSAAPNTSINELSKTKVHIKWDEVKTTNGKVNHYRVLCSKYPDKGFKMICKTKELSCDYNIKKKEDKLYFIVRPYGTTNDGKRLLPEKIGASDAILYEKE